MLSICCKFCQGSLSQIRKESFILPLAYLPRAARKVPSFMQTTVNSLWGPLRTYLVNSVACGMCLARFIPRRRFGRLGIALFADANKTWLRTVISILMYLGSWDAVSYFAFLGGDGWIRIYTRSYRSTCMEDAYGKEDNYNFVGCQWKRKRISWKV